MYQPHRFFIFLTISSAVLLVLIFHYIGWLTPVENTLRSVVNPSSYLFYQWSANRHEGVEFETPEQFETAYLTMQDQQKKEIVDRAELERLRLEHIELRARLHYLASSTFTHIGADVIGKNIEPLGSTLVFNRGSVDGVEKDNPVIVDDGILIGKITRVDEHTSVARLINDNQSAIAATLINRDRSIGVVQGGYGISVRMALIPQNETVAIDDIVITSGLEQTIPRGLVIGTVESVEKETYQSFQEAVVVPAVDLEKIMSVSILKETQR